jgi:membrane-associated phospholipid phosphatase
MKSCTKSLDAAPPAAVKPAPAARRLGSARLLRRFALALGLAAVAAGLLGLDARVYQLKFVLDTPDPLDRDLYVRTRWFWDVCRIPGDVVGGLLAYFVVAVIHRKGWPLATRGLIAVAAADALTLVLQILFGRVRPNQSESPLQFLGPAGWRSAEGIGCFPSGEATAAFALAWVLSRIYPRGTPWFLGLAALNALTRLVPGAHFLSDVTAGAIVGCTVSGWVFARLERHGESVDRSLERTARRALRRQDSGAARE